MSKASPKAEFVAVKDYPAMLDETAAQEFLQIMARSDTTRRMNQAIDQRRDEISLAVHGYVRELAAAAAQGDLKRVFERAHEIRGLAGTGGLASTGKIADNLCKYIDTAARLDAKTETAVIALHIDAIARSCSASEEAKTHSEQVVTELGKLVEHRLQAINESQTRSAAAR
jgi:chemotaxis protein histidine kinase CheA